MSSEPFNFRRTVGSLGDGLDEAVKDARASLNDGKGQGFIFLCCVTEGDDKGFVREAFGGNVGSGEIKVLRQALDFVEKKMLAQGPCQCPSCRAARAKQVH